MKVKHAELGYAAYEMIAMVAPGSDAGHIELQSCLYMSTCRCYPLCSELKVPQSAIVVQGRGNWRGQIMPLRGRCTLLSLKV